MGIGRKTLILSLTWAVLASMAWAVEGTNVVLIPGAKLSTPEQVREFARGSDSIKAGGGGIFTDKTPKASVRKLTVDIPDFGKAGESIWELAFANDARGIRVVALVHPETEKLHFEYKPWIEGSRFETMGALNRAASEIYGNHRGLGKTETEGVYKLVVRILEEDIAGFAKRGEPVWEVWILYLNDLKVRPVFLIHPFENKTYFLPIPSDDEKGARPPAPDAGVRGSRVFHAMENFFAIFPHNGKNVSTLWKT